MMRARAGLVAVALVLAAGCGRREAGGGMEERSVVSRVTLRDVVSQTGEVTPITKLDIKCEASGRIEKIFVKEGQRVRAGEKLLTIDPERLLTRKRKLDLAVEEARIRMATAKRDFDRTKELLESGTVPQSKIEDLQSQYELCQIAYKQQRLERDDVADQLRETTVTAPMAGVLTNLPVEEGEIVVSATSGMQDGTLLGTIADIEHLEVITQVGEVDYPKLEIGQSVVLRPEAAEGVETRGHITFLSLTAKKRTSEELGTFEVRIAVDSLVTGVVPGVNVNVELVVLERAGVLAVPYRCVQKHGREARVLAVRPGARGRAAVGPVKVRLGMTDYRNYEVLSGLSEGDTVVYRAAPEGGKERERGGGGRGPGGPH